VGEMVGVDFSRPIVGLKNADFESAHCFVSHNFLSYLLPVFNPKLELKGMRKY
jgi:hypothetical protein